MPSPYTVAVGSFQGPFDLLLQLIARRKLDIYDIPIAEITDDYLVVLREMTAVDLEATTDFLVVAATLVELKAARLLPVDNENDIDSLELEARDLLYARLLEYRTFKQASTWMGERLAALEGYRPRTAGAHPEFAHIRPPLVFTATPEDLARLAGRVFAEQPDTVVDVSHVQPVRMTVREAAGLVMDELDRAAGRATFRELTAGCRHRVEVIICFLALLELYKDEYVDLLQSENFGALVVEATDLPAWHEHSSGPGSSLTMDDAVATMDDAAPDVLLGDAGTVAGDHEVVRGA